LPSTQRNPWLLLRKHGHGVDEGSFQCLGTLLASMAMT
jgi:hypothetical protein